MTVERRFLPEKVFFDHRHPLWNDEKCHVFGDTNVLVEGLKQAQLLTKSIVVDGLPSQVQKVIDSVKIPKQVDAFMQDVVRNSFMFDAEQIRLPVRKVPDRPAFVLPRDYGISDFRRQ